MKKSDFLRGIKVPHLLHQVGGTEKLVRVMFRIRAEAQSASGGAGMPRGVTLQSCALQIERMRPSNYELYIGLAVPARWLSYYYKRLPSI